MTANERNKAISNTLSLCVLLMQEVANDINTDLKEDADKGSNYRCSFPKKSARREQIRYVRSKLSKLMKLLNEETTK